MLRCRGITFGRLTDFTLAVGNTVEVCYEQPRSYAPPVYNHTLQRSLSISSWRQSNYPRPLTSHRPSTSHTRRLSISARPLSQISYKLRKGPARRPVIGAPTDFRKVQSGRISPVRKAPTFRPLQLSIYLPGNELPELPVFWIGDNEKDNEEVEGVERPTQVLVKTRSEPLLSRRPSSSFSIPRKPLASRSSSVTFDNRYSMESTFTLNTISDFPKPPRSRSTDQLRRPYPQRRSSLANTRSTQDFLDALEARLSPPPPVALRSTTDSSTIYRRASEQSLRLRTHLEEREELEMRLPDLVEETSPLSPKSKETKKAPQLSPISDTGSIFESNHSFTEKNLAHHTSKTSLRSGGAEPQISHQAHSSDGSRTLVDDPRRPSTTHSPTPALPVKAGITDTLRNRLSQWLLKALPSLPPIEIDLDGTGGRRPSAAKSMYSISRPITAHVKGDSVDSYWTYGASESVDMEKAVSPNVSGVGVAF